MPQLIPAIVSYGVQAATASALGAIGSGIAGAIAGGLVAGALAPTIKTQGPRLGDLKVTGSAYGSVIPYVIGTPRLAGQIVWASNKRQISVVTESGGKGGGGTQNTNYTYEVDLLIELCDNVTTGITKVWSNGGLVWNKSAGAAAATILASDTVANWNRVTFYSGVPTQLPDATYSAAVGAANAPAYRGRTTVFIESLQLGSGGALPNLEFELADGVTIAIGTEFFSSNTILSQKGVALGIDRALYVFQNSGTTLSGRILLETGISSSSSVSGNNASLNNIIALTATTFLEIWNETAGGAIIGEVITQLGTPPTTFTTGIEYTISTSAAASGSTPWIGFISATQVLAVWGGATIGLFNARIITIAGTVLSFGTIYTLASGLSGAAQLTGIAMLTATSAVAIIGDSNTSTIYTLPISISGSVVTLNSVVSVATSSSVTGAGSIVAINSSSALMWYVSSGNIKTMVISASGVGGSGSTVITEANFSLGNIVSLSSSVFLITWSQLTTNLIRAIAVNANGGAVSAVKTINAVATTGERPSAVALSTSKVIIVWRNLSPLGQLTYNTLTIT
jgi:hypothetical protein